jgi:hypothetical protein
MSPSRWLTRRAPAGASAVAIVGSLLVGAAPAAAALPAVMTPAIGSNPHYQAAGRVTTTPDAVTFSCQLTDPGRLLVTVGDNTFHGPVTIPGFPAQVGWDASTGLGSPKAASLVPLLAGRL